MKSKLILVVSLVVMPLISFAAYDDSTFTTSAIFSVNGIELDVSGATAILESATVGATTLTFAMQNGSSVTIAAPSRNQMETANSSAVSAARVCSSSVSSVTFTATGSGYATITPSVSLCADTNTTTSSAGGYFSGGGSSYTPPSIPVATTSSPAVTPLTVANIPGSRTSASFTKDLKPGDTHADVKRLQQYLNAQGFTIATTGVGSKGKETNYFGLATKKALIKFQEAHKKEILTPSGLTKGTGTFGPSTRAFVNKAFATSF